MDLCHFLLIFTCSGLLCKNYNVWHIYIYIIYTHTQQFPLFYIWFLEYFWGCIQTTVYQRYRHMINPQPFLKCHNLFYQCHNPFMPQSFLPVSHSVHPINGTILPVNNNILLHQPTIISINDWMPQSFLSLPQSFLSTQWSFLSMHQHHSPFYQCINATVLSRFYQLMHKMPQLLLPMPQMPSFTVTVHSPFYQCHSFYGRGRGAQRWI